MTMSRQKQIVRASVIGIITNIVLVIFKSLVGVIAGSIAIILDAVNNLTDVMSSVVTIIGTKIAAKHPDSDHPYGHGRSEYLATLLVGLIIMATGVVSLMEAVPKIFHPELADYSWATIVVVVSAIIVKLCLGTYVRKTGKTLNSNTLIASGVDALFDAMLSFATLIGIGVTMIFRISIDGILGAVIALFILRTSFEIIMEAFNDILGRTAEPGLVLKIKQQICSFPEVSGAYDLMLHNYGPSDLIGSVRIQVPDTMTAKELHKLTHMISQRIYAKYNVSLTIGIYAENRSADENRAMREKLLEIVNNYPEVHQMHGFYVDESQKTVSFDLVIGYECKNREQLKAKISQLMRKAFPGYKFLITIDPDLESDS